MIIHKAVVRIFVVRAKQEDTLTCHLTKMELSERRIHGTESFCYTEIVDNIVINKCRVAS